MSYTKAEQKILDLLAVHGTVWAGNTPGLQQGTLTRVGWSEMRSLEKRGEVEVLRHVDDGRRYCKRTSPEAVRAKKIAAEEDAILLAALRIASLRIERDGEGTAVSVLRDLAARLEAGAP